jgi:heptosyltransferase-2
VSVLDANQENRIVVRLPNWLGDAVMATPALAAIHNAFPNASISLLVRENLAELFSACPFVTEIFTLQKVSGFGKAAQIFQTASKLRQGKFALAICFPHSFSSALIFQRAGIRHRIGYSAEGRKIFLTQSLPYPFDGERPHRVRFFTQLVEIAVGQKLTVPPLAVWPMRLTEEQKAALAEKTRGFENLVTVAPGSAGTSKRWFVDRYAEVVRKLVKEKGTQVVLVGASYDRLACEEVVRLSEVSPVNLAGRTSLSELYFLFQRSRLFLGNDSGAGHLAAASGVPVVILTGAGDPDEIAPWTEKKTVLFKKIFCSPCYRHTCRRKDFPLKCMDKIGTEEVWQAVHSWLGRTEPAVAAS